MGFTFLRSWKERLLAAPWIYDTIRPLAVGGIDLEALARFCDVRDSDRVFDLGCGTAQLLEFIKCDAYLGVDLDPKALERASRRAGPHIRFVQGDGWDEPYRQLRPTLVLMIGLVHHTSDDIFRSLIRRLRWAPGPLPRVVTVDVSYYPGRHLNNLLSRMDRGRYVRAPSGYEQLFRANGLRILKSETHATKAGYVCYAGYHLAFEGET